MTAAATQDYDRLKDIKQFDDQKIGVKGLVDSGINTIPRFFHHPPETRPAPTPTSRPDLTISTIDLSAPRAAVIREIHHASSTLGFFQIINHNFPQSLLHSLIASIKSFNEQPAELKSPYYHRDPSRGGAAFSTNFDLYQSKAASWRDTLQMRLAPTPPNWDFVPDVCREAAAEWDTAVLTLGEELMGLLSEGLGLESGKLKDLTCLEGRVFVGHYYPYCPEPDLTVGITSHTDPGVLTVLVQNEVGGLQVKCGEDWVDVDPIPGALVRPFTAFALSEMHVEEHQFGSLSMCHVSPLESRGSQDVVKVLLDILHGALPSTLPEFNSDTTRVAAERPDLGSRVYLSPEFNVYIELQMWWLNSDGDERPPSSARMDVDIMSNDEYKSVEHRVLANPCPNSRVSVAVFFNPSNREDLYGPFPELLTPEKPAAYRQFPLSDFMRRFFTKELDGKSLTNYYSL
ncbi:hypothetical protein RJ639_001217 [Escallonia herrerae]|uniref:Fe2OG dioxygenase domain-containing protein n=1 Tax=Escallonia herrerae TaxID=1293975 RepID=A0AA88XAI5_9ASTE|nr:hypothetical protein RJ639_001217 [Escallonia herrerae]